MKAIFTKFIPASNVRGARVKAYTEDKGQSVTISYPHELDGENAHRVAAEALIRKMKWNPTRIVAAGTKNGFVWTMLDYKPGMPLEVFKVNPRKHYKKGSRTAKRIMRTALRKRSEGKQDIAKALRVMKAAEASHYKRNPSEGQNYWLQVKAPAGNWVDSLGTQQKQDAINHGKYLAQKHKEVVRVVDRHDTVIWELAHFRKNPFGGESQSFRRKTKEKPFQLQEYRDGNWHTICEMTDMTSKAMRTVCQNYSSKHPTKKLRLFR